MTDDFEDEVHRPAVKRNEQRPLTIVESADNKQTSKRSNNNEPTSLSCKKHKVEDEGTSNSGKKIKAGLVAKKAVNKKRKGKKKEVSDSESDEEHNGHAVFPGLRIRTSPKSLSAAIQCLSKSQKQCVRDMGFGSFLKFRIDELPAKLMYFVLERLDDTNMVIRLDNGEIKVTPEAIHNMLGVPIGGTKLDELDSSERYRRVKEIWKDQFAVKKSLTAKKILRKIVISSDADYMFKLNFVALFVNTLGSCSSRGHAALDVLEYIKRDTKIEEIDWCRYLWSLVKNCKDGWDFSIDIKFFSGPVTILVLLYLDATNCPKVQVKRVRPTMRKWNYELMSYREEVEIENGGFGLLELNGEFKDNENPRNKQNDTAETQIRKGKATIPSIQPETVEEYIREMTKFEALMTKHQKMLQQMTMEATSRYPDHDPVKEWTVKVNSMFCERKGVNHGYKTPEKFRVPKSGVNERENMDTDTDDELLSSFWYSYELHNSITTIERELEKKKKESLKKSVKQTSKKIQFDGPSFSIGLTQEATVDEETEVMPVQAYNGGKNKEGSSEKGKEAMPDTTERGKQISTVHNALQNLESQPKQATEKFERERRITKLPGKFKSPYVRRVVDIGARLSTMDMKVWELINDGTGTCSDVVFETEYGDPSMRDGLATLARQEWVNISVIDSWAALLNLEEEKRNNISSFRLFCHTGMTDGVTYEEIDDSHRLKAFTMNLGKVVNSNPAMMNLKDVDMIFFPVMQDNKYYLICYNLKTMSAYIIDNQNTDADPVSFYENVPNRLHQVFMVYLKKVGHASWGALSKITPTVLEMNWRKVQSGDDSAVFLMRHMECFMGLHDGRWECGISPNSGEKKRQMGILRKKYTAKMLLSPQNVHLDKITQEANMHAIAKKKHIK